MSDTPLTDACFKKRQELRLVHGTADGVGAECEEANPFLLAKKLEKQLAERDAALARCEDALDHIMKVAGQAHRPTLRLDWISDRARIALSGMIYNEALMPQYPKNRSRARSISFIKTAIKILEELESDFVDYPSCWDRIRKRADEYRAEAGRKE